jgi:hypothetical protein
VVFWEVREKDTRGRTEGKKWRPVEPDDTEGGRG